MPSNEQMMPDDEQAGNGSGNVCAVTGCEGGDLFRLDIMGQPTTAYLCGDHVGFVRQFSLTMPTDEQAGDCCEWYRVDLIFHGEHFHAADGKRIDPRSVVRLP